MAIGQWASHSSKRMDARAVSIRKLIGLESRHCRFHFVRCCKRGIGVGTFISPEVIQGTQKRERKNECVHEGTLCYKLMNDICLNV